MSMSLYLKHVSQLEIARISRDGVDPDDLVASADGLGEAAGEEMQLWLRQAEKSGTIEQLAQQLQEMAQRHISNHLASTPSKRPGGGVRAVLDLHKSWHMLHFLFTGQAWAGPMPAAMLLAGGQQVGGDLGYGPARILSEQETRDFAAFLRNLDVPTLSTRLNMTTMQQLGIYCAETNDPGDLAELDDDLGHYFPELQAFVAEAADKQQGMLVWMS